MIVTTKGLNEVKLQNLAPPTIKSAEEAKAAIPISLYRKGYGSFGRRALDIYLSVEWLKRETLLILFSVMVILA